MRRTLETSNNIPTQIPKRTDIFRFKAAPLWSRGQHRVATAR
jgi:hypothetical protein